MTPTPPGQDAATRAKIQAAIAKAIGKYHPDDAVFAKAADAVLVYVDAAVAEAVKEKDASTERLHQVHLRKNVELLAAIKERDVAREMYQAEHRLHAATMLDREQALMKQAGEIARLRAALKLIHQECRACACLPPRDPHAARLMRLIEAALEAKDGR